MIKRNATILTAALFFFSNEFLLSDARADSALALSATRQADYLFFLSGRDRVLTKEAALAVLDELDARPLDANRLAGVYRRGAPGLRKKNTEHEFSARVMKYREGLDRQRERIFQGVEGGFRFLPNQPDGQYVIVTFDTVFGAATQASPIYTEQLTFARNEERPGLWELLDYYLALKPFYKY